MIKVEKDSNGKFSLKGESGVDFDFLTLFRSDDRVITVEKSGFTTGLPPITTSLIVGITSEKISRAKALAAAVPGTIDDD